jgi:hypothetical protein
MWARRLREAQSQPLTTIKTNKTNARRAHSNGLIATREEVISERVTEVRGYRRRHLTGRAPFPERWSPWTGRSPLKEDDNYANRVNSGNRILRGALFRALQ